MSFLLGSDREKENQRVEAREAEKQKQPTIHKYLAHLTVSVARKKQNRL